MLFFTLYIIIKLWNDHGYIKSSVYSHWLMVAMHKIKNILNTAFPNNTVHEFYQDPGKEKVIAHSVTTTTSIAFIFTRYCLFSVLLVDSCHNDRKFVVEKKVDKGRTYEQILEYWYSWSLTNYTTGVKVSRKKKFAVNYILWHNRLGSNCVGKVFITMRTLLILMNHWQLFLCYLEHLKCTDSKFIRASLIGQGFLPAQNFISELRKLTVIKRFSFTCSGPKSLLLVARSTKWT